ncbi:hypothetical protein QE357_004422 [Siphonobacter sp. BAB-5404]|nr:hypothetical protein [Siphonobacter sp. SORGH_AS_0500]
MTNLAYLALLKKTQSKEGYINHFHQKYRYS